MAFVGSSIILAPGAKKEFLCGRGRDDGACRSRYSLVSKPCRSVPTIRMVAAPESTSASPKPPMSKRTKTAIITGASSGIGKYALKSLVETGEWNVVMAVRNAEKAKQVADEFGLDTDAYSIMDLDLASLESVRAFADSVKRKNIVVNTLICNAATWFPKDKKPRYTVDGFEESVAVNYLGHFLLVNLMLKNGTIASTPQRGGSHSRVVFIGTETHNPDTLPGKIPPQADLADLQGFEAGFKAPIAMISGKAFEPTKAYKDSKVKRETRSSYQRRWELMNLFVRSGLLIAMNIAFCDFLLRAR